MLYHVSQKAGLRTLQPHVSTHGRAYVYAIEDRATGLLFGTKKDDFDLIVATGEKGAPEVYECYPDAFRAVYQGKGCSVYEVEDTGFLRGMTSWSPELVCEQEVAVQRETVVEDLYGALLEEEGRGALRIHRYEFSNVYRKRIAAHVVDRVVRFGIDLETCLERDGRFAAHYQGIVRALAAVMDGHLLA